MTITVGGKRSESQSHLTAKIKHLGGSWTFLDGLCLVSDQKSDGSDICVTFTSITHAREIELIIINKMILES